MISAQFELQTEPCDFLPNRKSTRKFRHPYKHDLTEDEKKQRREQKFVDFVNGHEGGGQLSYEFVCASCRACIPLRINVEKAELSNNQRRTIKKNSKNITVTLSENDGSIAMEELRLTVMYNRTRKLGPFLNATEVTREGQENSHALKFLDEHDELIGIAYLDISYLSRAAHLNANIYDPNKRQSLGTYMTLQIIEWAKQEREDIDFIYIGSWAKNGKNLDYKKRFPGLETLVDGKWVDFDPEIHITRPQYEPLEDIPEVF